MKSDNIVLVGFMGTGKSTIAKLLAKQLAWTLVDTDDLVEQKQGRTISELFQTRGESYFRKVESDVLREVMAEKRQIVATGGGSVLLPENRRYMLDNGFVVALTADEDTIIRRVRHDKSRPLLQGGVEEKVGKLLAERKHVYNFADISMDTSFSNFDEMVQQIMDARVQWIQDANVHDS